MCAWDDIKSLLLGGGAAVIITPMGQCHYIKGREGGKRHQQFTHHQASSDLFFHFSCLGHANPAIQRASLVAILLPHEIVFLFSAFKSLSLQGGT